MAAAKQLRNATTGFIMRASPRSTKVAAFAASACLTALVVIAPARGQVSEEVLKRHISSYANELCGLCHDLPAGEERAPRIAGQRRAYIEAQLYAFRRASRGEPEASDCMWGLSSALSDGLVAALAAYFSAQTPLPGIRGDPVQIQAGRELFYRSGQVSAAPACVQCHGENAAGSDAAPRLAGQLAPYLLRQMQVIRLKFRESPNMHGIVQDLSDADVSALAAYLQSL